MRRMKAAKGCKPNRPSVSMETKPAPPRKPAAPQVGPVRAEPNDVPAAKPKAFRRDWGRFGCAAMLGIAAVIPLAIYGLAVWAWYDATGPIGVVGPDRWPLALADNYDRWQKGGASIDSIEVFATNEDMLGGAAILKVPDKPETWEYFQTLCAKDVKGTSADARERWEAVAERFPGWAPILDDPNVEILPGSGPPDATILRVARDPANETIYIDYFFDF